MTAPVSTVEAITREIADPDATRHLLSYRTDCVVVAALEVAKAMCEVPPHLLNLEARLKLAELLKALQR